MAKYDYKLINKKMEKVEARTGHHIGKYSYVIHEFPDILRPRGLSGGGGKIMSYEEAYERKRKAVHPDISIEWFTKDYYNTEIEKFYNRFSHRLDLRKEVSRIRRGYIDVIESAYEVMGKELPEDLHKKNLDELKEFVKEVNDWMSDKHYDKTDSPKFYERIVDTFKEKLGGNGDAETK